MLFPGYTVVRPYDYTAASNNAAKPYNQTTT